MSNGGVLLIYCELGGLGGNGRACSLVHGPVVTFTSPGQGCPGWHSARSGPEVGSFTTGSSAFSLLTGPTYGEWLPYAPPSWTRKKKGLCPVGDHRVELAQERASQQRASLLSRRSVSNGPGESQRMTYIGFLAPAGIVGTRRRTKAARQRVRLGSWGQDIIVAAVSRGVAWWIGWAIAAR